MSGERVFWSVGSDDHEIELDKSFHWLLISYHVFMNIRMHRSLKNVIIQKQCMCIVYHV